MTGDLFLCPTMEGKALSLRALSVLRPGEGGIVSVVASHHLAPKLVEMGLFPGKEVKVLFRAPFGGPMAVEIGGGYTLSLREDEAMLVLLDPENF